MTVVVTKNTLPESNCQFFPLKVNGLVQMIHFLFVGYFRPISRGELAVSFKGRVVENPG